MHLKLFLFSAAILFVQCAKDSQPVYGCPPIPAYQPPMCPKCKTCPTPKPVEACPTVEPVTCAPVTCPAVEPVVCPTPKPVKACPTVKPVVCPTLKPVVCPTLKPFVCPTLKPVEACPVCKPVEACPAVKPVADCEHGWTIFDKTKQCYKVGFNKDFPSAENDCIANNAHLTSIHSKEENIFVNDLSKAGATQFRYQGLVFIGITIIDGKWQNVDGTPTDYFNWLSTEPNNNNGNEFCVLTAADELVDPLSGRSWWGDIPCDMPMRAYVCKKAALNT